MATYKLSPAERRARAQAITERRENRYTVANHINEQKKAAAAQADMIRQKEIEWENERSSQGFLIRGLSTIGDLAANVLTGAIKGLEGIYDLGASIVGGVGGLFSKDFQDSVKEHVSYDWTGEIIGNPLQELTKYSYTDNGGIIENVASGLGQMLPAVAVTVLTAGAGAPAAVSQAASLGTLGVSAAGNSTEAAFNDGAGYWQGLGYGIASGAVEVATEKLTGGLTKGVFGRGLLDNVGKSVADTGVRRIARGVIEEGAEEVIAELANPTLKAIYKGSSAFEEYKNPEYWKGVAEAGVVGGLTSLAYGGTVGKVINTAKGVNEDISDSLTQIETLEKKRNNLFSSDKLTEQNEGKISDNIIANYRNVETALQKASEKNREKYIKNYNLSEAFETDGTMKSDFAARLTYTAQAGQTNATDGETAQTPLASLDKRYYHPSLRGREQQISEQLAKQGTKVYSGELTDTEQANYSRLKKAFNALSQKGLIQPDFVLAESSENFYSYLDGKTVVFGKDTLESDLWQQKIIHEVEHFTEGTKEWSDFASFVLSETDTTEAVQSVLRKGYGITQADVETLQSALSEGALTDNHRLLLSEVMATQSEALFGNEQMIERLTVTKRGLARKLLDRIKNFVKVLKAKTPEEKTIIKKLEKAQQLFEKALDKAGAKYAASQVDSEGEIQYNRKYKKGASYSQYRTLAMQWAYASDRANGDHKALYNASDNTWNLIVADDSDEGFSVLRSIKDIPQNTEAIQNLFGEVYNEDNRGKQGTGALVRSNNEGYESVTRYSNVHNGASQKRGANGRTRGVYQGESKGNRDGNSQKSNVYSRVKPKSYHFGEDGNNSVTYSDGKTTKFSLKAPIEYTKDLIAVHNLSESKLLDSISLGGFAMPSIAILKSEGDHNYYGDISVVFRPNAVDPEANADNKIYSADAYTPRFPQTEYSLNRKAMIELANKLNTSPSMLEVNEFEGGDKERMLQRLSHNRQAQELFVKEKGLKVVPVLHDPEYSHSIYRQASIRDYLASGVSFHEIVFDESTRKTFLDTIKSECALKSLNQKWADKINRELNDAQNDTFVYGALEAAFEKDVQIAKQKADKIETDSSYNEGLSNLIEEHQDEYSEFIKKLAEPVLDKRWLRNNKNFYTDSGNPRSFESLHEEYTADNAVKIMRERGVKNDEGGIFGFGVGEIRAALSKTYNSSDSVHKDESRILNIQDDYTTELCKKCSERLGEICSEIADLIKIDNQFMAHDIASSAIFDIISKTKTDSSAKAYIKKNYTFEITTEQINAVRELAKEIERLPVKYFEAKPKRVVEFNEVAAVVVPSNMSSEVRSKLDKLGIKIVTYDKSKELSRKEAVNSIEGIRFFLKDSEGKTLTEQQVEYFKDSKVRDSEGNLLVVYHGTNSNFYTFDKGRVGKGIDQFGAGYYFTTEKTGAGRYGKRIINSYLNITNPFEINMTRSGGGLDQFYDFELSPSQAYDILKLHPDIMDSENSPLGNFSERFWEVGATESVMREVAKQMTEIGSFADNSMFGYYPNELNTAIKMVLEIDGLQVNLDNGEKFFIAWQPNQIKEISNINPTTNEDIRFSLKDKYFYRLTEGQIKKLLANNTKFKVYSKTDAESIVNNVLGSYMAFGDKYGDLRGKSKKEVVEILWRGLNTAETGKQGVVALDVAEYIIQHSAMENLWDDGDNQAYIDTIAVLKPYLHNLDLSSLRGEIKHRYDTDNSPYLIWGKRKEDKGQGVDVVAQELAEQGFYIEATNEADIFFEIDSAYRNALQAMKKQARQMLNDSLSKEQRAKLKQEIAREILKGFDYTGKPSILSKIVDKYADRAREWKQKYLEEKNKNKAINRLLYKAQKLKDIKLGIFLNASQFKSDVFKGSIEKLANIKYRGDLNRNGTRKIVAGLAEWYSKDNPILEGLFDEEVSLMLDTVSKGEGKLTVDEIKMLDNIVSYFAHFVETYNKVYRNGKYEDALPIAKKYVEVMRQNKPVKIGVMRNFFEKYTQTFADPMTVARYMDRYDEGFYSDILTTLREGAVNASVMEMEMREPLEEFYKKHKVYLKGLKKRTIEYQGQKIPVQQALLLYMTLNREQALAGLAKSGFAYEDGKETVRLKGFDTTDGLAVEQLKVLAKEQQKTLQEQFSEADKEYIAIAEKLFNETCKEVKRKTDLLRKGYSNALEDYYVPIRRAYISHSVDTSTYADEMNRVSNASFNRDTVKGAKNELFIESLESVLDRHIRAVSQYANLSMAVDEYDKLFNLDIADNPNKPTSVKTESVGVWKKGDDYFKKLISDMQGIPVVKGEGTKVMGFIRSGYAKYQLGANPKVWLTQLSSFAAAGSILDVSSITKGLNVKASDVDEYCSLAKVRNNDNTVALAQGVIDNVGKVGDVLMKPIGKVDRFVIKKLFGACQVQVQKDSGLKIGTEENKKKAGELLKKVILETQQNALSTERSAAMRSGNELVKTLTMFTSDAMKVVGRVIDSVGELSVLKHKRKATTDSETIERLDKKIKSANKQVRKSVAALATSAIFMALIAQLFRWLYNKDDEEETGKMIAVDALGNLLGGLPIFKDIYARLVEGYDLDNYAYSTINNLFDSVQNLFDMASGFINGDTENVAKNVRNTFYAIGQLFGIPLRNIYNVGFGLINRFSPSTAYKIDDMFYNKNYRADLKKAIEAEDEDMIATITGIMLDENIGEVTSSAVRNEIDRLVKAGYDVIPRSVGSSVTHDGETTELTAAQVAEFKTVYATAHNAVASLISLSQYGSAEAAVQAKAMDFIYEVYYKLAVENLLGVDLESKNTLFAEAIDIEKLAIIVATARQIAADTDKNGKALSGTRKAKIQVYFNSLRLTAAQKYMIMGYLGYSNTKGESQVKSYINTLPMSKTEKAQLLKWSGYAA